MTSLTTSFRECADLVQRLAAAVTALQRAGGLLQLEPLEGREWFELLRRKLLPQLRDDTFLVAAVVGGTNIGKSVIFNHIAGCRASATSPLASGTKHPVCLVPPSFTERHDLAAIFEGFELSEWTSSEAALEEAAEHRLYWRTSREVPENLLVLDTPDIDSDAPVNWRRADSIRQSADVLIAVLTQQKYNDAAVKRFFRQAAAEDKAVIVIFNQCELPEDDAYWPLWLKTFCDETKIQPEFVYIAPNDRRAAEENRLPFYERRRSVVSGPLSVAEQCGANSIPRHNEPQTTDDEPRNLRDDLSRLHFAEIKLRALGGSLVQILDPEAGVPAYLREVEQRSAEFRAASGRLSSESIARVKDWPTIANHLLVDEIRAWWKSQQHGWARQINLVYDSVGQGMLWPFRFARKQLRGEEPAPLEPYRKSEWGAILRAVEEVFDKLSWMAESGSELLRPRFERLLEGKSRSELVEWLKQEHRRVDFEAELTATVNTEMQAFQTGSPELYAFYRQLNNIAAAVRPVTSVVLFTIGWGPAGHAVAPLIADAAVHTVVPIVVDLAGGATAAVAGDAALAGAAGRGAGFLQAKFQKLQTAFTTRRVGWLAVLLKERLLGSFPEELEAAARVPESHAFRETAAALRALREQVIGGAP